MKSTHYRCALWLILLVLPVSGIADDQTSKPNDQIVVPEVSRRDVHLPSFPSNDVDIGVLAGKYSTQNFGTSTVEGIRIGYNITEDFFVQSVLAKTNVSDATYRQILPGGVFPTQIEKLSYYNFSLGYNILPGEVFVGTRHALPVTFYVLAGVGSTTLDAQKHATVNVGSGMRLFLNDYFSLQLDARDHLFSMDLLGTRQRTQNLEMTMGLTISF